MKTIEQFVEDAKNDAELQEKLKAAAGNKEIMNAAIAEAGYAVTVDDIVEFTKNATADLSDTEVEALAGGSFLDPDVDPDVISGIYCAVIGAGCACWA